MALTFHRSRGLFTIICMAAATAVTSGPRTIFEAVASAAVCAWRFVCDLVLSPILASAKAAVQNLPGPAVAIIAARQFYQRQIKRERPVFQPQWRACPST